MHIIAKVGDALQCLFGPVVQAAALEVKVIQRVRKFTSLSLAKTFILGYLHDPQASDEKLAQMAVSCGADVTPQAIDQRHTWALVDFFEEIFRGAIQLVVGSDRALAPLLERFSKVIVIDSSTITLPDEFQDRFPGCGGGRGGGAAALKLQTELELRSGAITHVEIEPGRSPDGATSRQQVRHGVGTLRIADLGYFSLSVFTAMAAAHEYFLSRLQFGTGILHKEHSVNLLQWLAEQTGPLVDVEVTLGKQQRIPCRLIAWRVPEGQANQRRHKLRVSLRRKGTGEPSKERLEWCDWTILVTNVSDELLTRKEAIVMYRSRWQVELLFKRWKSQTLVGQLCGSTVMRQMVRLWARLIAALVQHWMTIGILGGDPTRSIAKACEAIRPFVYHIATARDNTTELEDVFHLIRKTFAKTCRRDKRSSPGTFELLNNVELLDFVLT